MKKFSTIRLIRGVNESIPDFKKRWERKIKEIDCITYDGDNDIIEINYLFNDQ
jgi:hypothetical protein